MIEFSDTCLYGVLQHPVNAYYDLNAYSFALYLPVMLTGLVLAVAVALVVDVYMVVRTQPFRE